MLASEIVWREMEGAAPHTPFRLQLNHDLEGLKRLSDLCGKSGFRPLLVIEEEQRRRVEEVLRAKQWPPSSDRSVVVSTSHLFDLETFTTFMREFLTSIQRIEPKRYVPLGW